MHHTSVANSKPEVELDSHADMCVVGNNCLVIYDYNRLVNVYSYNPKDDHRRDKTVDATVDYQDPQSSQKFILMINQAISNDGLDNHILYPMQCHQNGVQISEVLKFLAENLSETIHAIELVHPFDAAYPLIISLWSSGVTSYFDMYFPSVSEYENDDIPKTHLTAEEPPWAPSTSEYSERETCMTNHQGQKSIPATAARGPVFVSAVVSYSLAYDAAAVMDNYNLATALESQIQISIMLIGMVRKPSVDPIVLAKHWGITPEKALKTIQATTKRGIRMMLHPSLLRRFRTNDFNLCYC